MNWKSVGVTLCLLAVCLGIGAICAPGIADSSVSIQQQAKWGSDCFFGWTSACEAGAAHKHLVGQWEAYSADLGIAAAVILIVGLAILVGALSGSKIAPTTASETDVGELSPEEIAQVEKLERELALRGARLD